MSAARPDAAGAAEGADAALAAAIEAAWEARETLGPGAAGAHAEAVEAAIEALDSGRLRVATPGPGGWQVHAWLKKAVLLAFQLWPLARIEGGPGGAPWWDRVPPKAAGWSTERLAAAGVRMVPGALVRRGAHVAPGAVLMPSFVNIGAFVGPGTMIDTWATVGSCAQVGAGCHISGGVGIGGVLEPLQAAPVIIEDHVFIGARSEVAEGVIVEEGAVLSMGVFLGASTRIIDRETGEEHRGRVPAYSVVVPGTLPGRPLASGAPGPGLVCAVIVKRVDARTRAKTSVNELLRGH